MYVITEMQLIAADASGMRPYSIASIYAKLGLLIRK